MYLHKLIYKTKNNQVHSGNRANMLVADLKEGTRLSPNHPWVAEKYLQCLHLVYTIHLDLNTLVLYQVHVDV